jgi:predicted Zn-dependent peptidase
MLNTFTLKNGIKVATYRLPQVKSVHINAEVKAGSVLESDSNNGVAHFMEHMLVQGIPSLPNVEKFSSFIEGLAGTYGATTDPLTVDFHINLPFNKLETGIKIASEVIFEPLFVEEALEKERVAVINELLQRMDSHFYKISRFFKEVRYPKGHPLYRDTGGELEIVKKVTIEDLKEYWKEYFLTNNTYFLVTGNFEENELKRLLEKYFEKAKKVSKVVKYPGVSNKQSFFSTVVPKVSNKDFTSRTVALRNDSSLKTAYIDFSFPGFATLDPDKYSKELLGQSLLTIILGRLRNSRLFKLLRYQKGLVYGVSAGTAGIPGINSINISSETGHENLEEVVRLITAELIAFVDKGLTEKELEFAKYFMENQWLMSFDHPSSIASWIGYELLWKQKIHLPEDSIEELQGIDNKFLLKLMKEHWDFGKLNLVIQGPVEESAKEKYEMMISKLK